MFAQTLKIMFGTPDKIRTCDLRLRSPLLYPAELPGHTHMRDTLDYTVY